MRLRAGSIGLFACSVLFLPVTGSAAVIHHRGHCRVAKDATGAVLPGVSVEAASPALIEKVRTVVTDGEGQYKIVDLRPGTYTVTFTLDGFNTVKRENVDLTAGFTAAINADMKVGSLEETVTVTGASPTVDIQNVNTQNVLSRETLDALPSAKSVPALAALTVGVSTSGISGGNSGQDVGGNKGEQYAGLMVHGSDSNDGRFLYDGMRFNMTVTNGGGPSKHYFVNQDDVQEIVTGDERRQCRDGHGRRGGQRGAKGGRQRLLRQLRADGRQRQVPVRQPDRRLAGPRAHQHELGEEDLRRRRRAWRPPLEGQTLVLYGAPVVGHAGVRSRELLQRDAAYARLHA